MYKEVVRPVLDHLDSERMHHLIRDGLGLVQQTPRGLKLLEKLALGGERFKSPRLENNFGGFKRENTSQLGAGADKPAVEQLAMHILGDGGTVFGGITPLAQEGNKKPRQFVFKDKQGHYAEINNLGLNNSGAVNTTPNLLQYHFRDFPIIASVAFNKDTVSLLAIPKDFAFVIKTLYRYVDGFQILISCPNLHGPEFLHQLHQLAFLEDTAQTVIRTMELLGGRKRTDIKVGGDATLRELLNVTQICSDYDFGMVGINTSGNRDFKAHFGKEAVAGGFSGDYGPYRNRANEVAALVYNETGGKVPFTGSGANYTGPDAWTRHLAGAQIIEDVTGRRIHGPEATDDKNRFIAQRLEDEGTANIAEVIGKEAKKYKEMGYPNIPRE